MIPVILVKDGVVKQKWVAKTIEQLQDKHPDADLREVDAVCGQLIDDRNIVTNPPPTPPEPAIEQRRQHIKALLDQIPDGPQKEIDKILLADMLSES